MAGFYCFSLILASLFATLLAQPPGRPGGRSPRGPRGPGDVSMGYSYFSGSGAGDGGAEMMEVEAVCGSVIEVSFDVSLRSSDGVIACKSFPAKGSLTNMQLSYALKDGPPNLIDLAVALRPPNNVTTRVSDEDHGTNAMFGNAAFHRWTAHSTIDSEFYRRNITVPSSAPLGGGFGSWMVCLANARKTDSARYRVEGTLRLPSLSACQFDPSPQPTQSPVAAPVGGNRPSAAPTKNPTKAPTAPPTAQPTARPTTAPPTAAPTAYLGDVWLARFRREAQWLRQQAAATPTVRQMVYGEVRFGDDYLAGGCKDWGSFLSSQLAPAAAQNRVASVTLYTLTNLTTGTTSIQPMNLSTAAACSDSGWAADVVSQLIAPLPSTKAINPTTLTHAYTGASGGNTTCAAKNWKKATCAVPRGPSALGAKRYATAVCVDCPDADTFCDDATCSDALLNPCGPAPSSCAGSAVQSQRMGSIRFLVVRFQPPAPAPAVTSIVLDDRFSKNTTATVTTAGDARVSCGIFFDGARPTSLGSIEAQKRGGGSVNNVTVVPFRGLTAATNYTVYCMTTSKDGVQSTLSQVLSSYPHTSVVTACCRNVRLGLLFKSVPESTAVQDAVVVGVDALPSGTNQLQVSLSLVSASGATVSNSFFPSDVLFSASTVRRQVVAFQGLATAGTYTVVASLHGTAAGNYDARFFSGGVNQTLEVKSSGSEPATPALLDVQFSDNGGFILATFDSATDSAGKHKRAFNCSDLWTFDGSNDARCQWRSSLQAAIFPRQSALVPGDSVTLKAGLVKAECPKGASCGSWATVGATTVLLEASANAEVPVVSVTAPETIGSCDFLRIDLSASRGNGGRHWSSVVFSVSSTSTSATASVAAIQAFLDANYTVAATRIPLLPNYLFSGGTEYVFSVELCNFLGACGSDEFSVVVLGSIVPSVTILSPALSTMRRAQALVLRTKAFTAACDGSRSSRNLDFTWEVSVAGQVVSTIVSESVNQLSTFKLSPRTLQVGVTYTFSVTALNTDTVTSSTHSVSVFVEAGELEAKVFGGSVQSVRVGESLSLSAAGSRDSDDAAAVLSYQWECSTIAPTFSSTCPLTLTGGSLTSVSVTVSAAAADVGKTARVVMTVSDAAGSRVASTNLAVVVLPATAPSVTISLLQLPGSADKFNPKHRVVLVGEVRAASAGRAVWTIDDAGIELAPPNTLTPTNVTVGSGVQYFNMVLKPWQLAAQSTYTFTLTCTLAGGGSAHSTAVVTTNGPPLPGTFDISPSTGEELTTEFTGTAALWTDDDLPLTYAFAFYATSATSTASPWRGRNQAPYASTTLAAGPEQDDFAVRCVVRVFDSLDAFETMITPVTVNVMAENATLLALLIQQQLAESDGDADSTTQAVSTATAVLNSVNCTGIVNCDTDYNRESCGDTSFTCGECLAGFVGVAGSANEECVNVTVPATATAGGTCSSDGDCFGFQKCNTAASQCQTPDKKCGQNCTDGNGVCVFVRIDNTIVQSCPLGDPTCDAVCDCSSGWAGEVCSYTADQLDAKKALRSALIDSLVSLTSLQDASSEVVESLLNSILGLIAQYEELDGEVAAAIFQVSQAILDGAAEANVTAALVSEVLAAVDTAASLIKDAAVGGGSGGGGGSRRARRLHAARAQAGRRLDTQEQVEAREDTHNQVAAYAALAQADFVYGQEDDVSVEESFRIVTSARLVDASASPSPWIDLPRTSLEEANAVAVSGVSVLPVTAEVNDDPTYTFSLIEIESQNVTSDSSNLLELLSVSQQPCIPTADAPCLATVVLRNRLPVTQAVPYGTDPAVVTCNTTCSKGSTASTVCECDSNGDNDMLITCPGMSQKVVMTAVCATSQVVQSCQTVDLATGDLSADTCTVQGYTQDNITCGCEVATTASSDTQANFLSVAVEETTAASVVMDQYASFVVGGLNVASFAEASGAYSMAMKDTLAQVLGVPRWFILSMTVTDVSARRRALQVRQVADRSLAISSGVRIKAKFRSPSASAASVALTTALGSGGSFTSIFKAKAKGRGAPASAVDGLSLTSELESSGVSEGGGDGGDESTADPAKMLRFVIPIVAVLAVLLLGWGAYMICCKGQSAPVATSSVEKGVKGLNSPGTGTGHLVQVQPSGEAQHV